MIFLCDGGVNNLKVLKRILRPFELASGLKVKFSKSKLYGLNVTEQIMEETTNILDCDRGSGAISYPGMRIEMNHNKKENRNVIVEKIKSRLPAWKGKNISLGGRATLIQPVLSAIPIYSSSFFSFPKSSLLDIIRVQREFSLGWG
ncbi:hypothetical protein ACS0TY_027764 [Phlomoides rotata]